MTETTAHLAGDATAPAGEGQTPSILADARRRVHRALAIGAVVLLALVLAIAAAVISDLRRDATTDTESQMRALSLVLADRVAFNFHAVGLIEKALVTEIREQNGQSAAILREKFSTDAFHRDLAARTSGLSYITALSLWDSAGEIISSSQLWPAPVGRLDGDPAQRFRDNPGLETLVTRPSRTIVTGSWAVRVIRRVSNADGGFIGMVV